LDIVRYSNPPISLKAADRGDHRLGITASASCKVRSRMRG
jgi:hypothetical protein